MNFLLILFGKFITWFSTITNRGNGSTWPGHVALETNKKFIRQLITNNKSLITIFVAGTNGKTTTSKLIRFLLEKQGLKVFQNESGANLLNGIASALIQNSTLSGKLNFDAAIFEVDENVLPLMLKEITPAAIVLLNLFRDQLDRYGEVNTIAKKWKEILLRLNLKHGLTLIVNGDDPTLSFIAQESQLPTQYFGVDESLMSKKETPHDVDFLYCPRCTSKLEFPKMSYSHMGLFKCPKCGFSHTKTETFKDIQSPLFGIYNIYNTNAAILVVEKLFGISIDDIKKNLPEFKAAFGRQEELEYKGRKVIIQLSKNPTGFNQSIEGALSHSARNNAEPERGTTQKIVIPVKTGIQKSSDSKSKVNDSGPLQGKQARITDNFNVLLILNDRIPDGRDISWIWDVDLEKLSEANKIFISGDRTYDMALRMKYALKDFEEKIIIEEHLEKAVEESIRQTKKDDILFILPTYSAMLEVRKIIGGKKIL